MQYDENTDRYGYDGEMTQMKCDTLKSVYIDRTGDWVRSDNDTGKFLLKTEVDAAIAELKEAWRSEHAACEALKAKLENVQASTYADSVDTGMRERRLNRALWLARAERAKEKQQLFLFSRDFEKLCIDGFYDPYNGRKELSPIQWVKVFNKVEIKCLKKAEEYNG